MKKIIVVAFTAVLLSSFATAFAQNRISLRVHHFMSVKGSLHAGFLEIWKKDLEQASQGRIRVTLYDSMSLGGKAGDLYDQAVDGAVDIILTLSGYTPGRFNKTEVFELPFMMEDPVAMSKTFYQLVESDLQKEEYRDTKILAAWVHGPGIIHSKEPIATLADFRGKSLRGPSRIVTNLLAELGATPVGMPLPAIAENLSKGVIEGAVVPWEVTPTIKLSELVSNHTIIQGDAALYTATFILAMNLDVYEDMPADLRQIFDRHIGLPLSVKAVQAMVKADAAGQAIAEKLGNRLIVPDKAEVARWVKAAQPVYAKWINEMKGNGFDGQKLIDRVKTMMAQNR